MGKQPTTPIAQKSRANKHSRPVYFTSFTRTSNYVFILIPLAFYQFLEVSCETLLETHIYKISFFPQIGKTPRWTWPALTTPVAGPFKYLA